MSCRVIRVLSDGKIVVTVHGDEEAVRTPDSRTVEGQVGPGENVGFPDIELIDVLFEDSTKQTQAVLVPAIIATLLNRKTEFCAPVDPDEYLVVTEGTSEFHSVIDKLVEVQTAVCPFTVEDFLHFINVFVNLIGRLRVDYKLRGQVDVAVELLGMILAILDDLNDVCAIPTADGWILVYDSGTGCWTAVPFVKKKCVYLTFPDTVAAGTAIDIQDGTYSGGGPATVEGDILTLPASQSAFDADGDILVFYNGQMIDKLKGSGAAEVEWVSTTQLKFCFPLYADNQIKVRL